jgi:hypothetical protein
MKKYKTYEAIQMLSENKDLRFTMMNSDKIRFEMFLDEEGFLAVDANSAIRSFEGNVRVDDEWTLIKQPVSFMEAIKSYSDGKNIYVEIKDTIINYSPNEDENFNDSYGYAMYDTDDNTITTAEILNGKWYIGEE